MNNNKERLILEEYQPQFDYEKSKSKIDVSFNRVAFIFFIFLIISVIFSAKAVYLGSLKKIEKPIIGKKSDFRSTILDRNGNILAKSVLTTNVGINPKLVINKKKLLLNLKLIFPEKDFKEISKKLNGKRFFYLEKKINHEKYEKIFLLGDKSIKEEQKISRIYPQENLFSHIIGQIDDDNNGISGIEKSFDYELRTSESQITLTVDSEVQYLIREELVRFSEIFQNKGSSALLMKVNDGEILSMVSLPDFNLNKRQQISDVNYINRSSKGVYELGSVFKTFTIAAALDEGLVEPETEYKNLEKKIWCAGNPIEEYDEKMPSDLTVEQILIRSGNIGSVRIAQAVGIEKFKNFLIKIGILGKIKFDIEEVGNPQAGNWGKCKLATSAYGHGISTTALQLAKGYSIISNGGYEIKPTLIKNNFKKQERTRILKEYVSEKINPILRKVVSTKEGTANFADIPGYEIGGKTGTADQPKAGTYSEKKVNTFAAIFPTSKPKYVLIVLLDDPKPNKEYVYHYRDGRQPHKGNWRNTAGWTSVEIAGKIIEKIGPILATKY